MIIGQLIATDDPVYFSGFQNHVMCIISETSETLILVQQEWSPVGDIHSAKLMATRRYLIGSRGTSTTSACTFKVCAGRQHEKFVLRSSSSAEARRWIQGLTVAVVRVAQRSACAEISDSNIGAVFL